jgi:natural resistance-associated macrophage protein 2
MQQGKAITETSPLLQHPSLNKIDKIDEQIATNKLVPLEDRLIEAEIDTGEVEDAFSWRKLWKYTGPGEFYWIILIVLFKSVVLLINIGN